MDYTYTAYTEDKRLVKGKVSAPNEGRLLTCWPTVASVWSASNRPFGSSTKRSC